MIKTRSSYLKYWDVNNLYGLAMSQKLPVNNVEWIEETSRFSKDFIKSYNDEIDAGYFLEIVVQYPKKLLELHHHLPFLSEKNEVRKCR